MDLQLCVDAKIDADAKNVRLVVTGHLTVVNQRMLYPLIRRSRALTAETVVVVDLAEIDQMDPAAVDFLVWELEHDPPGRPVPPVGLALPGPAVEMARAAPDKTYRTIWVGCDLPRTD